eukprot:7322152-Ditylum_brightwellii.AAC.1
MQCAFDGLGYERVLSDPDYVMQHPGMSRIAQPQRCDEVQNNRCNPISIGRGIKGDSGRSALGKSCAIQ